MRAGESAVVDFFTKRIPLFPVLNSFEKNQPQLFVILGLVIFFAQHVGFIVNTHFRDVLGYILGGDIANIFYGFHLPLYDPTFVYSAVPSSLIGMTYAALVLSLCLFGSMLFYYTSSATTDKQNPAFVYLNRMLVHSLTTILLIPLTQICFSGMVCGAAGTVWHYAGVSSNSTQCWSGTHLATFVPSGIMLATVIPLLYLALGCQYDSSPESDHLKARRHSLVDELGFAHDVLSCLLFQVLLAYDMRGAFAIIHCISAFALSFSYAFYLPYYELGVNQFYCATHAAEGAVSLVVAAALTNKSFALSASASTLIISLTPFAVVYAVMFATYRINPRYLHQLQMCMTERPPQPKSSVTFPTGLVDDTQFPAYPDLENQVVECITRQEATSNPFSPFHNGEEDDASHAKSENRARQVTVAFLSNVYCPADVALATGFVAATQRQLNEPPSLSMLLFAAKIYSRGLVTFPSNVFVQYCFAVFIVKYIPSLSFLGLDLIESVSAATNVSMILRYRAHFTAGELRLALGIRNQAHLLHSNKARSMHCKVLTHMNNFWMKLTEPSVNIGLVSEIAEHINVSRDEALQQFRRALQHQTNSDALLVHRMGDFLRDVMMDVEGAAECYNEAKEIHEARQARSMRGTKQHTTVELDVETLTDRLITLLEGRREGTSGHSSSVVQYLLMNVSVIFVVLLAVIALFLYVAVDSTSRSVTSLGRILNAAVVRKATSSFAAEVQALLMLGGPSIDTTTAYTHMAADAAKFSTSMTAVAFGRYSSSDLPQKNIITDQYLGMYQNAREGDNGYALWSLAESTLSAMQSILRMGNESNFAGLGTSSAVAYLTSAEPDVTAAVDYIMELTEAEVRARSQEFQSWSIALFVVGCIVLALIYVSFLVSFRRTALGRVFTFQLFTLIPFDDLEKLAADTKDKVQLIQEEKKQLKAQMQQQLHAAQDAAAGGGQNNDDTASVGNGGTIGADALTSEVDNDDVRKGSVAGSKGSKGSQRDGVRNSAACFAVIVDNVNPNLKSCLRRPNAPRSGKRVVISSLVETFGGKSEEEQASVSTVRKEPVSKRAGDGENDDESLLLDGRQAALEASKKKEGDYTSTQKTMFMFLYGSVIVGLCVAAVMLGVSTTSIGKTGEEFLHISMKRVDLWRKIRLNVNTMSINTAFFVAGGDKNDLRRLLDAYSTLRDDITSASVGWSKPQEQQIAQYYATTDAVLNGYLDAVVLAAKHHVVDVSSRSLLRSRLAMPDAEFINHVTKTYVDTARRTQVRAASLGRAPTLLDVAWSVLTSQTLLGQTSRWQSLGESLDKSLNADAVAIADDSSTPPSVIAALALFAVCAIVAVLLMVPDVESLTAAHVGRVHLGVLVMFICVPLAITAALVGSGSSVADAIRQTETISGHVYTATDHFSFAYSNLQLFAATGDSRFFFQSQNADFVKPIAELPSILEDHGLVSPGSATLTAVTRVNTFAILVERLQKIAFSMATVAFQQQFAPETAMLEVLNHTTWAYQLEDEYQQSEQMFPNRSPKYSTRAADVSLGAAALAELSQATVNDLRAKHYFSGFEQHSRHLVGNVSSALRKGVTSASSAQTGLLFAALGSCALWALWSVWLCVNLAHLFTLVMGLQASTNTNSMDTSLYTTLINRCQYALLGLGVMLAVTFGVSMWATQTASTPLRQLNLATERDYLLAQSLYNVRTLLSNSTREISESLVSLNIVQIRDNSRDLLFGPEDSPSFFAAGVDTTFDDITFGNALPEKDNEVLQSYFEDVCRSFIHGGVVDFPQRGPYGGFRFPTLQGLFYWRILLSRVSAVLSAVDSTPDDVQTALVWHALLTQLRDPFFQALDAASAALYDNAERKINTAGNAFIGVSVATMFMVVVVYVTIVLPTVQQLVDEDNSAKLLLRMIPMHVRDQVPAIAEFIETGKIDNAAELQRKFEASEKLLQNILPQKIAARLKSGEQPIADTHPCLTILFTDFVGFTKRSSSMRADEIVDFLNEVFLEFDTIVELLELEKIKTIGDAYFMAGGLDPRISDHAMRVIEAGMMFFRALDEHNARHPDRALLQMRLGIHTGPAVAGVIGTKKVAYDLWGESVEIANAMESTGVPGKVHISEDTAKHVTGFYKLEPRGELPREKEHIPDNMPATFLITGRQLPTPYQHIQRPRMLQTKIASEKS